MVRAISAFLEFCYLVRRDIIDEAVLMRISQALDHYHQYRVIFITTGVRETISLPRQHAMKHYIRLIRMFGSPNGLCSSMMEAKHIVAVKRPYRRSSKNKALGQIIKTNQRLDKLAAFRVDLTALGMLDGPCPRLDQFMRRIQASIQEHNNEDNGFEWSSDSSSSSGDEMQLLEDRSEPQLRRPLAGRLTMSLTAQGEYTLSLWIRDRCRSHRLI